MASTFFGLNISTTGMNAFQASVNTTAHNISNAQTEGYSKQVLTKQASQALRTYSSYGMQGSGVDVTSVKRERNSYYDTKYWNNSASYGQHAIKSDYMSQIEDYFNELDKTGFTKEFDNFNNALVDLTSDPSSSDKKELVNSYASSLCEYFNSLSSNLKKIQSNANDEIKITCDRINSISDQLLSLNKQIKTIEITGEHANDLRDQRDKLIDELSTYGNVTVKETDVYVTGAKDSDGNPLKSGIKECAIYLDNQLLTDGLKANHLVCTPRENNVNMNDAQGLYDITWNNASGGKFELDSASLDGKLKGLFEIRDGNNKENFTGKATAVVNETNVKVDANNISDVNKLNINDKGYIKIGSYEYKYDGFSINYSASGDIESYDFNLSEPIKQTADTASVGESIDFKGIPYYQSQLNEFVRTFAQNFNKIHNQGVDSNGNSGLDYFTAENAVSGMDMALSEANDATLKDKSFSATADGYRNVTAANIKVNSEITNDSSKLSTKYPDEQGVASCNLLKDLIKLKSDNTMFKEGNPSQFLQSVTSDISVDSSKASNFEKSLKDVITTINNQRASISGVDTNEELANLVMYRNGYNLCSKMISVFNQIYNKLINETGL